MTIDIRALGPADVDVWRVLRLEALTQYPENFLTTLAEEQARSDGARAEMLARRVVFAAFLDGAPAGTLAFDPQTAASEAHRASLNAVYVRAAHQGAGIAQALLDHAIAHARAAGFLQLELCVAAENTRAQRFYQRNGFVKWGHLPRSVRLPDRYQDDFFYYLSLEA